MESKGEGDFMNRRERIKDRLFNKEFLAKQEWWGDEETILVSEEIRQLPLIVRKAFTKPN